MSVRSERSLSRRYDLKSTTRRVGLDRAMVALAAAQHGVVASWQLRRLGFTQDMLRRRFEAGRLYRLGWGVYSLTPSVTGKARVMAAVLGCGPAAVLSHRTAAAIWDIGPWPSGRIHVTAPSKHKRRPGVVIHRAHVERVVRDGLPITTVARTLVDLSSLLSLQRLGLAFDRAERLGLLHTEAVAHQAIGRRGARKIAAVLASLTAPEPTRSEFERQLRAVCERHDLPLPAQNVCVAGEDVDAYWPQSNLVVQPTVGSSIRRAGHSSVTERRLPCSSAPGSACSASPGANSPAKKRPWRRQYAPPCDRHTFSA